MSFYVTTRAVAAACVVSASCGCAESELQPQEMSIQELDQRLKSQNPPKVFDANGDSTRREYGVIPGATLLSGSSDYPLDMLPTDRSLQLVFYCASSWCGAANTAAQRAMEAGYSSVSVLPDGIKGWKSKGLAVVRPD